MATIGFDFAETYVTRKLHMEKMKKRAQEEEGEKSTNMKISTIETGFEDKTSTGCFSWVSKKHNKNISRISDYNDTGPANS
uniref:Uncharacterized protein n=1 Tax=Cajanus cajan TaxID=3821 RepID=A0A151RYI1_CAJCA|nr:hypothetical protein KK1_030824 [Cajanus cajan]